MMKKRVACNLKHCGRLWLMATAVFAFAPIASAQGNVQHRAPQSPTSQPAATQTPKVPDWQIAAGTKREFDVVSIRKDISGNFKTPSFALDPGDGWQPQDGLFHSDFPLVVDIEFAYKLSEAPYEDEYLLANQPKWVSSDIYEIKARAEGKPTKDQMRLMMQSMFADRFKLVIHFETRQVPVLALTLIHPGKLGPKLRPHAQGPACDISVPPPAKGALAKGPDLIPPGCALFMAAPKPNRVWLEGARDVSVSSIADYLSSDAGMDRPIVDQTGLNGNYDFSIQYTAEPDQQAASGAATGPQAITLEEALKEQLGMKLIRTTAPVRVPVIDHIERPSEN
jgi:bla regulator protein BlaR1